MPTLFAGRHPDRTTYGMESVLAHAIPTPVMENNSSHLSWIIATESKPAAPHSKHSECVFLRPSHPANPGSANENRKQTAEYIPKHNPAHSTQIGRASCRERV